MIHLRGLCGKNSVLVAAGCAVRYPSMKTITPVVLLGLLAGCAQTRNYEVKLRNESGAPITYGLVKRGEPFERKWASPEQAAINGDKPPADMWGTLAPGRMADPSAKG